MKSTQILAIVAAAALGILIGIGGFTLVYAKGYSYLLDDPQVCVNCHVMRENMSSWVASSHKTATCNDCHLPHQLFEKYLVKAEHGIAHSWAFTFTQPQSILIKERSLEVVEHNCASCHEAMISSTLMATDHGPKRCSKCHAGAGHPF